MAKNFFPKGSPDNPIPVNASKMPKGTVFGAPTKAPMKPKASKKTMIMKKKKVAKAAGKAMGGLYSK